MKLTRTRVTIAVSLVLVALVAGTLRAVLVAPHAIFIDHRTRTAQLYLVNTGDRPEEVRIDLKFGYPATDSLGNIFVKLFDDPPPGEPSAAGWIKAFPRTTRVAPGQRQVVRLLATPPAGLPDGEYWSRLIVTSKGGRLQVAGADSLIQAGLSIEIQTIISVTYRKGLLTTGVELTNLQVEPRPDSLIAWMHVRRTGTAAFLGTANFRLLDENGRIQQEWPTPIAVYHELNRRFSFATDSIPPGTYTLEFDIDTGRDDLDPSVVLPADSIHRSMAIRIP